MQAHLESEKDDVQIPLAQRRPPPPPLAEIERRSPNRNAAIMAAYATGGYSYQEIANYFEVHFTTVGKIIRSGG
jgi:DNA-directed RNA polymerase specialized sigma24 family protein